MLYTKQKASVLMNQKRSEYLSDVTGDACVGDRICFLDPVLDKSKSSPRLLYKVLEAEIVRDSYASYQQNKPHTFTLVDGKGRRFVRPAKTIYSCGTLAIERDPKVRAQYLKEKHARGSEARLLREKRREELSCRS